MTDQQTVIEAIERAGVVLAEHIDPRITSDPEQTINRLIAVLDTQEVAGAIARLKAEFLDPDGLIVTVPDISTSKFWRLATANKRHQAN